MIRKSGNTGSKSANYCPIISNLTVPVFKVQCEGTEVKRASDTVWGYSSIL